MNLIHLVLVFDVVYFILVHVGEFRRSGGIHTDRVSVTGTGNWDQGNMVVTDIALDAVVLHAHPCTASPFNVARVSARKRACGAVFHGVDAVFLGGGEGHIDAVRIRRDIRTDGADLQGFDVFGSNGFFWVKQGQRLKA